MKKYFFHLRFNQLGIKQRFMIGCHSAESIADLMTIMNNSSFLLIEEFSWDKEEKQLYQAGPRVLSCRAVWSVMDYEAHTEE